MHNTVAFQDQLFESMDAHPQLEQVLTTALVVHHPSSMVSTKKRRGRQPLILDTHLWFSLLMSMLYAMASYQDWWRLFCSQLLGPFQPCQVSDDALIKRLRQAGLDPLQRLASQISQALAQRLAPLVSTTLAPFTRYSRDLRHRRNDARCGEMLASRLALPSRRHPGPQWKTLASLISRYSISSQRRIIIDRHYTR